MSIWMVKFDSYVGSTPTHGLFDTKESAEQLYRQTIERLETWSKTATKDSFPLALFSFKDDWGFSCTINLLNHSVILMTLENSVKMTVKMQEQTKRLQQQFGAQAPPGFIPPSPQGAVRPQ